MSEEKNYISKELKESLDKELEKVDGGKTYIITYVDGYEIWIDKNTGDFIKKPKKKGST